MTSHKNVGGIDLTLGKGGLRFKKKKSPFNVCIAKEMKGAKNTKGRYDTDFQKSFVQAAFDCGATISPAKKKKWGIKPLRTNEFTFKPF